MAFPLMRSKSVPPVSHQSRSRRLSCNEPTNNSIATWSCYLKYNGIGGFMNGSGVIVEFDVSPTELQSQLPGLQKLSSPPETCYALLTCHHTIPDWQATQGGWWLYVGSGKRAAHKLDGLVCGVISCCGENGIISSGSNRSNVPVLLPHQKEVCRLKLDFTMLLLNQYFERQVMKRGMPRPPRVHIPRFPELSGPQAIFSRIVSDAASGTEDRMQLYHREEADIVILPVEIDQCLSTNTGSDSHQQLKDEIATYKKYQRIHYTQSVGSGEIVAGYSGSALVYYYPDTEETQLVGIHVGIATDEEENDTHTPGHGWYIGVSIYGIFQLLSGNPAAFFAVMEHHSARRMWSFRWAHLLTHQLEKCKSSLSLGYLVEILQQIFEKSLIQLDFKDLPENILAALQVLTAIFKCFEISGQGDVAAAIEKVYAGDKKKIKEFEDNVTELTKSLPNLLLNVGTDDEMMAKACSECYNVMLNFKYEGIVQGVLHTGDSLASLCQLHKTYKCPEILGNFIDILLKCRLIMKNKHVKEYEAHLQRQKEEYESHQQQQQEEHETQLQRQREAYEAQLQQQKEEYETQLQQQKEEYETQLQQQKEEYETQLQQQKVEYEIQLQQQKEEYKAQQKGYQTQLQQQREKTEVRVQQLKEEHRAMLQQQEKTCEKQKEKFQTSLKEQKAEMEGRLQRHSAAEQQLKTKNARLILDIQSLQVEQQRLQLCIERLKKEKGDTAAATEQYRHEVTALSGTLEQLKEEKRELEGKVQQQEHRREMSEKELQETRQKAYEQLTTAKAEIEKWRSRVAEYERQVKQLSEELEQTMAENEKLHRQLGGLIN